jgi:hypothetical protein
MKTVATSLLSNAVQYREEARRLQMNLAAEAFKKQLVANQEAEDIRRNAALIEASLREKMAAEQLAEQEKREAAQKLADEYAVLIKAEKWTRGKGKKSDTKGTHSSVKLEKSRYRALVWKLTNQQDLSSLPNIHLREWRKFDLDHIISIYDGFRLGLPAKAIASPDNLRIIPHRENADKGVRSDYNANPLAGLLVSRR